MAAPGSERVLAPRLIFPESALAPAIGGEPADHLLKASVRDEDIVLRLDFPLPEEPEEGESDTLQLLVDGKLVGDPIELQSYRVGDVIDITLAATDRPLDTTIDRRIVPINYVVTYRSGSGQTELGPTDQSFVTDIVMPGRESLASLVFSPEVIAQGVTPETLEKDDDGNAYLSATVKAYLDQSVGDVITGFIDDTHASVPVDVSASDIGNDVELRFDIDVLGNVDDGALHAFQYRVRDRAGNVSIFPPSVDVPVRIEPHDLAPIHVPGADDGLVTTEDADVMGGVLVAVPGNEVLEAGDAVRVTWNAHAYGPFVIDAEQAERDPAYEFVVPYAEVYADWLAVAGDGDRRVDAEVSYEVLRNGMPYGRPVSSTMAPVNLHGPGGEDPDPETPAHGNLRPPTVRARPGDPPNVIPADAVGRDATATLPGMTTLDPAKPAFDVGDRLQLFWNGRPVDDEFVVTNVGVDVSRTVPGALVQPGSWQVHYVARRALGTPPFESVARSPDSRVRVADPAELPGEGRPLIQARAIRASRRANAGAAYTLTLDDVRSDGGGAIRIPSYANMAVGDRLAYVFQGYDKLSGGTPVDGTTFSGEYELTRDDLEMREDDTLLPPLVHAFVDILVPPACVLPIAYGRATFNYQATNAAGVSVAKEDAVYVDVRSASSGDLPLPARTDGTYSTRRFSMDTTASPRDAAHPYAPLPRPNLPAALDGGLGHDDIKRDPNASLVVQVGPWADFQDGDTLQILWTNDDRDEIVATQPVSAADADAVVSLGVAVGKVEAFGEGVVRVVARVISGIGGDSIDSLPLEVRVKFSVPGGVDPEPHTPYLNENLASPTVAPSPLPEDLRDVSVLVAPYENMIEGDVLTVSWGGRFVGRAPLTAADVEAAQAGTPIAIAIPEETIRDAGGGDGVPVSYQVRDLVNNWSLWAPYLPVDVPIVDPDAPMAPWVEPTVDDQGTILDLAALGSASVTVLVESHGGGTGDGIVVHWRGFTAADQAVDHDTAEKVIGRPGQTLSFSIPNDAVSPLAQGRVSVTYTLRRVTTGEQVESRARRLAVNGSVNALVPPSVSQAVGDVIDPGRTPGGATVVVPAWNGIAAGDKCTIEWRGTRANGQTTFYSAYDYATGGSSQNGMEFTVPLAQVEALVDGSVSLSYVVDTYGSAEQVRSRLNLGVQARLESPARRYDVRDASLEPSLPAPSVPETENDMLDPDRYPSAHLQIPVSASLRNGDRIDATVQADTTFTDYTLVADRNAPPRFLLPTAFIAANRDTRARASYTVSRTGYLGVSGTYAFGIGIVDRERPAPTVDQADGANNLDPVAAVNGVTVRIPVPLESTETVTATFGSYTTNASPGAPALTFTVPASEVARYLDQTVDVFYTVSGQTSKTLRLHVLGFSSGDPRLPAPSFKEASGDVLDLGTFAGEPRAEVKAWPLMAVGQRAWIHVDVTPNDASPTPWRASIRNGAPITAMELASGGLLDTGDIRRYLEGAPDGSTIELSCRLTFDGSASEAHAVSFPAHVYTLKTASTIDPPQLHGPTALTVGESGRFTASGGTGNLRFSSSNTGVAIIDATRGDCDALKAGTTTIKVTDDANGSDSIRLTVTAAPPPAWDETFDFDNEAIRDISSMPPYKQLQFPNVFYWFFNSNQLPSKEQFIGIKAVSGTIPEMSSGRVLRIGHDDFDTLIDKNVLCQFRRTWATVRFAITAIDDPVTVDCYEDLGPSFSDAWRPLRSWTSEPSQRNQEVVLEAPAGKTIKWIRIRCPDTIHIDYFKMRANHVTNDDGQE